MRTFDARTTSDREVDLMRAIEALRRSALCEPERSAELFEEARALLPPLPLKVQIQTTTRCNAACAMCPYPLVTSEEGFEHGVMSEERYRRILDDLRDGDVERLSLFLMNEPLLDRRLPDWVALARETLPNTTLGLFTNGAALDARRARSLAEAGLDELCVSVHGFEAETYERVMAGLSFARLERNLDQVFEAVARKELGAMTVQIVTGDVPEITDTRDLAPLHYRDRIVLKAISNERDVVGVESGLSSSYQSGEKEAASCQRLFVKLYVLTTGDCVLCNVDWRRSVVLGRVGDPSGPSLASVWRGERYTAVRREHFTGVFERATVCNRCDYARVVDRE